MITLRIITIVIISIAILAQGQVRLPKHRRVRNSFNTIAMAARRTKERWMKYFTQPKNEPLLRKKRRPKEKAADFDLWMAI